MNRNERLIARRMFELAAQHGWTLFGVDDREEFEKTTDTEQAILLACNLDDVIFTFQKGEGKARQRGNVMMIFGNGNDGLDVVSDYHTNLEEFMEPLQEWVEELEGYVSPAEGYLPSKFFPRINRDRLECAAPKLRMAVDRLLQFIDRTGVINNPALAGMDLSDVNSARYLLEATGPIDPERLTFTPLSLQMDAERQEQERQSKEQREANALADVKRFADGNTGGF